MRDDTSASPNFWGTGRLPSGRRPRRRGPILRRNTQVDSAAEHDVRALGVPAEDRNLFDDHEAGVEIHPVDERTTPFPVRIGPRRVGALIGPESPLNATD